jgi:hypothetical protein
MFLKNKMLPKHANSWLKVFVLNSSNFFFKFNFKNVLFFFLLLPNVIAYAIQCIN